MDVYIRVENDVEYYSWEAGEEVAGNLIKNTL